MLLKELLTEVTLYHGADAKHSSALKPPIFLSTNEEHAEFYMSNGVHSGVMYVGKLVAPKSRILDLIDARDIFSILDDVGIKYQTRPHFYSDEIAKHGDGGNISDMVYVPKFKKYMDSIGKTAVRLSDVQMNGSYETYVVFDASEFAVTSINTMEN